MDKGKWIVRIASLVILLGFFLPFVLVSCSGGFVNTSQSLSIDDIASYFDQNVLYLLPISVIVAAIITILPGGSGLQISRFLWMQIGSVSVGIIFFLGSIISIINKIQNETMGLFEVSPAFGSFFLVGGIIAAIWGLYLQWKALPYVQSGFVGNEDKYIDYIEPPPRESNPGRNAANGPYLEVVSGVLSTRMIPIFDNFTLGRSSSSNHFQLPESSVSRQHACFRYSQGMWFLQDQESSAGTFVNGSPTEASRIYEGDEITIGPYTFIFHAGG